MLYNLLVKYSKIVNAAVFLIQWQVFSSDHHNHALGANGKNIFFVVSVNKFAKLWRLDWIGDP